MTATSHGNDTTVVTLPALTFDRYRALVAQIQAAEPLNRERIARGLNVLLTCELRATAECGVYAIQSCADAGTYYTATTLSCTCPDATRGHHCKHAAAVTILHAAYAEAAYERAQTRYLLTPKGEAALAARA